MNSPSSSDNVAALIEQISAQLQAAVTDAAALDLTIALAQQLEQACLEGAHPLLAGAAICIQQRLALLARAADSGPALMSLAEAWQTHGGKLLTTAGQPEFEEAWLALQPHLAPPVQDGLLSDDADVGTPAAAPALESKAAVDAGAFLDSLDEAVPGETAPVASVVPGAAESAASPLPDALTGVVPAAEETVPPEILEAFAQESREAFEAMEQSILAWEKDVGRREDLRNVFRLAHSVKGAANSVGLKLVGTVLHRLEDMLEDLVEHRRQVAAEALSALVLGLIDALRAALASGESALPQWQPPADALNERIQAVRATVVAGALETEEAPEDTPVSLREELPVEQPVENEPAVSVEPVAEPVEATTVEASATAPSRELAVAAADGVRAEHSTIRVETSHLDSLMNLVGDLLINRHRLNRKLQQVASLRAELVRARERLLHVVGDFNSRYEFSQRRHGSGQVADGFSELELDRYDDFNILSRSLVEIAADAEEIVTQIDGHFGSFSEEAVQFTTVTRQLQEEVARTRMVPLDQLFRRLNRAIRDACASEGKQVRFVVEGADNRIDKFISDQLFRPLLHVVRNAVAHGIESAAERAAAGKPAQGQLLVKSRTEAGRLVLEFIDDGGGLRRDAIIRVARARGLLAERATPDDAQLAELIFQPGFSTAASTTDVSGRGVGLDVVRQELTNLGGTVTVLSRPGQGCAFSFTLPVTLAINQVMFVQCGAGVYALPINFVERVVVAPASSIRTSGNSELLMLDQNQTIPLIRLHDRLALPGGNSAATAIILTLAERRTALLVDRIQSKLDIVVKPLGPVLQRHPYFSGATLAGDGRVIFILDVPNLLTAGAARVRRSAEVGPGETDGEERARRVLVVDDSLSIRRIAATYLTGAGLDVDTAVDGSEALEKLRGGGFGVVVSDLEMPRVNGFELIAEMRRQSELKDIPVIILTSRDAPKHRERATELGAAQYLIKPVSREQLTSAVTALLERADSLA